MAQGQPQLVSVHSFMLQCFLLLTIHVQTEPEYRPNQKQRPEYVRGQRPKYSFFGTNHLPIPNATAATFGFALHQPIFSNQDLDFHCARKCKFRNFVYKSITGGVCRQFLFARNGFSILRRLLFEI